MIRVDVQHAYLKPFHINHHLFAYLPWSKAIGDGEIDGLTRASATTVRAGVGSIGATGRNQPNAEEDQEGTKRSGDDSSHPAHLGYHELANLETDAAQYRDQQK